MLAGFRESSAAKKTNVVPAVFESKGRAGATASRGAGHG